MNVRVNPTEFKIVRSDHKLHFQFEGTSQSTTQNVLLAAPLLKKWLKENIEGPIEEGRFGITPELVLNGDQMDEFDTKWEEYYYWIDNVYKKLLSDPVEARKEVRKIKEESKKVDETKEISEVYTKFLDYAARNPKQWPEASEVLTQYLMNHYHFYTTRVDNAPEIYIYVDGIYVPQGRTYIKEQLANILGPHYDTFITKLVMDKIEAKTYIDQDKFLNTVDKENIPVQNGILNIITRQIVPFTPERIFFNKLPVTYDPNATCPMIDKFLESILAKEEDKLVYYELAGYCLYKESKYEISFMFNGGGRNGKGKSLQLIREKLLGATNCVQLPLSALKGNGSILSTLANKMANIGGDIDSEDLKDTGTFKTLLGRDATTVDRKYLNPLSFTNYAKFIFACNTLPIVYDNTMGFWSKWVLMDFPYTFVKQEELDAATDKTNLKLKDESIIDKISTPQEISGFLNAALDGFARLEKNKGFSTTRGTEETKQTWMRRSNSFAAFALDNIEESYACSITKRELRHRYSNFCKKYKLTGKSDRVISKFMEENFGSISERKTIDIQQEHVFTGVAFKTKE